jgi:hypothetical protein
MMHTISDEDWMAAFDAMDVEEMQVTREVLDANPEVAR